MVTENFYGSKPYLFEPNYKLSKGKDSYGNFTNYNMSFSQISTAVDPRTANQIKEVSENLNTGVKNVELGALQPNVFEAIPKDHFKEMQTLAKLTGAELTFHAPMIDPTGITQQGWDKMLQKASEEQLWHAIKAGSELNPKGTVVTYHASSVGLPAAEEIVMEKGKPITKSILIINENDGKIGQVKEEKSFFEADKFGAKGEKILTPTERLKLLNEENWSQTLSNLSYYSKIGYHDIDQGLSVLKQREELDKLPEEIKKDAMEKKPELFIDKAELKQKVNREIEHGKHLLRDTYRGLRGLYDDIYNKVPEKDQIKLREFAKKAKPFIEQYTEIEKDPEKLKEFADAIEEGVNLMGKMKPQIYTPIKQFAIDRSAETAANLALRGFTDKDLKQKGIAAPIIAIENHPAQQSLITTGEELRGVVKKAQQIFIEKAISQGISKSTAEEQAKKLIGVTWDVGHINMLRKYGFSKEDLLKQTEAIAPYVKKVHLSDNFGFDHTELPMGMGNVPLKEMMAKLGKEGVEAKKIVEAGDWWQHFSPGGKQNHPLGASLRGLGANLYSPSYEGAPAATWNQIYGTPANYFAGYGTMLPEQNFNIYGAGFSTLPIELGGQVSGKDSRFSGTPMA